MIIDFSKINEEDFQKVMEAEKSSIRRAMYTVLRKDGSKLVIPERVPDEIYFGVCR